MCLIFKGYQCITPVDSKGPLYLPFLLNTFCIPEQIPRHGKRQTPACSAGRRSGPGACVGHEAGWPLPPRQVKVAFVYGG